MDSVEKTVISERNARYHAANREKIAKRKAAYYSANREKIAMRNAEYRARNREKISKRRAEYRARKARPKQVRRIGFLWQKTSKPKVHITQSAFISLGSISSTRSPGFQVVSAVRGFELCDRGYNVFPFRPMRSETQFPS